MDISTTITILETLSPLIEAIPLAGESLAAMLRVAVRVCESAEGAKVNRNAYIQLAQEIAGYASAISQAAQSDPRFSSLTFVSEDDKDFEKENWIKQICEITSVFSEVMNMINQRRSKDDKRQSQVLGAIRRYGYEVWHKEDDEEQVKRLRKKVEDSIRTFHIGNEVGGLAEIERIKQMIEETSARQTREREAIAAQHAGEMRAQTDAIRDVHLSYQLDLLKRELNPVRGAQFNEEGMPNGCLVDTREQLLNQLYAWANDNSDSCPLVFGLTGLAGTGKTTVAISFCEYFDAALPVVSFFISRTSAERSSPKNIIHTIAYQLGRQRAEARAVITGSLQDGRDIIIRTFKEQVEGLFTAPLRVWEGTNLPLLVVIDALDECNKIDGVEGGDVIPQIIRAIRELSGRAKLLITSREEPEIWKMFERLGLKTPKSSIRLQNIEDTVVKADIERYYKHYFRIIAERARPEEPSSWPTKADFDSLVELTGRLFVFAALVVRVLRNPRGDPQDQLDEILRPSTTSEGIAAFRPLDSLYSNVLGKAVDTGDEYMDTVVQMRVQSVIGALVLLQAPLSGVALSSLLGEKANITMSDLKHLSAVLTIPDNEDGPVTIFHPSFADFVLRRCVDLRFRIDADFYHAQLLRLCLIVMNRQLKRDICDIRNPSVMNAEIEDLAARCNRFLPPELRYACEYWPVHLIKAGELNNAVIEELNTFSTRHILHWIEAMSLLDRLPVVSIGLTKVIDRCRKHQSPDILIVTSLLEDAERVAEAYELPIRSCALQLYCSVLLFIPRCKLYGYVRHEVMGGAELRSTRLESWSPLRRTLEGHTSPVWCVAYSSDGRYIASTSADNSVRVWDANTGRTLTQLTEHATSGSAITFSPDGTRIAAGFDDYAVRVGDTITGCVLNELTGHCGSVISVAFSPDGTRIASGSDDHSVRVWDAIAGTPLASLTGHTNRVWSVAFSPDGMRIASGSDDHTVRVWDATAGRTLASLLAHTGSVTSVAFSPDGTRIAFGSEGTTVQVWDVITGRILAFTGHTEFLSSVAFSVDGSLIASGSADNTVRVWDANSGRALANLTGHSSSVTSVAFSSDGTRIVSGSSDNTVRVWSIATECVLPELAGHSGQVTSVAFSSDGIRFASGSADDTVRVWDITTGRTLLVLTEHSGIVRTVAFSPDGTRIASAGSFNHDVLVWDAITGHILARLTGHTSMVLSVAFSPDGTLIVSGSRDQTVRVWDAITGHALAELKGHEASVDSVAFSEDGLQIISSDVLEPRRVWNASQFLPSNRSSPPSPLLEKSASSSRPVLHLNEQSWWLELISTFDGVHKPLCWIPPERRGECWTYYGTAVLFTPTGGITIVSLSQ